VNEHIGQIIAHCSRLRDRGVYETAPARNPGRVTINGFYGRDLAGIHAAAFGGIAEAAAGDGWAVGTVSEESGDILPRNVTTFRRDASGTWRRGHETHRLALLATETVLAHLEAGGFEARACESYGPVRLPAGLVAFRSLRSA
jgi:hypothetical protein